ncbi:MAG: quercetin dioxygenase-like cupin family protein [Verrucomicrobiales bacterium]
MPDFLPYSPEKAGTLSDLTGDIFPSTFTRWDGSALLPPDASHFLYIEEDTIIQFAGRAHEAAAGMYLSLPGEVGIQSGRGIATSRHGYNSFFLLGGPVEEFGRLRYIDGCTDSLLIPPVTLGDPCLNLLHIPPHTEQTRHTHPSFRTGIIISGSGECVTPDGCHALTPGLAFLIPANAAHSFHTSDEALRVIAFHPDSDFGPTDETHPMVNRTIIE